MHEDRIGLILLVEGFELGQGINLQEGIRPGAQEFLLWMDDQQPGVHIEPQAFLVNGGHDGGEEVLRGE